MSDIDVPSSGTSMASETLVDQLQQEKNALQSQNGQLWRLVDKQRAMILGLQKDLDKLKEVVRAERSRSQTKSRDTQATDHTTTTPSSPLTPRTGGRHDVAPQTPNIVEDYDESSTNPTMSPESASSQTSAAIRNRRRPQAVLDFGEHKSEELPLKSPLRLGATGRGQVAEETHQQASRVVDGTSSPMSPALSVRMQKIRTVTPRSHSFPFNHVPGMPYEEVERVSVPRRERVRTSSQRSISSLAIRGPATALSSAKEEDGLQSELTEEQTSEAQKQDHSQSTAATLSKSPPDRIKTPDSVVSDARVVHITHPTSRPRTMMPHSESGDTLADIAAPYYAQSSIFLPLPERPASPGAHGILAQAPAIQIPAKLRKVEDSPASLYEEEMNAGPNRSDKTTRVGLEPSVEFFPSPGATVWQEHSPERSLHSSIFSSDSPGLSPTPVQAELDAPQQTDVSSVSTITPGMLDNLNIYLTNCSSDTYLEFGLFQKDMQLVYKLKKSYNDLIRLQAALTMNIGLALPPHEDFMTNETAKSKARRATVDLWFLMIQAQTRSLHDSPDAKLFYDFLSTDIEDATSRELRRGSGGTHNVKVRDSTEYEPADIPTSQPYDALPTTIYKEGYLSKRGKNFGGWKSRYFILDGPELRFLESPGGAAIGSINLLQAQISTLQLSGESGSTSESGHQHAFLILEPKKRNANNFVRHTLCANTDADRDDWIRALLHFVQLDAGTFTRDGKTEKKSAKDKTVRPTLGTPTRTFQGSSFQNEPSSSFSAIGYNDTVPGQQPLFDAGSQGFQSTVAGLRSPAVFDSPAVSISRPMNGAPINNNVSWGASPLSPPANTSLSVPSNSTNEKKQKKKSFWTFGKSDNNPNGPTGNRDLSSVRSPSSQDLTFGGGISSTMFGAPLADAVQMSRGSNAGSAVPIVVYRCIEYLDARHAEREEGIYRLSGSNTVIKGLKDRFNQEVDLNLLGSGEYFDVHAVAGLLKLYLRELPSSILTRDLQRDFLDISEMPEGPARMITLRTLVHSLPRDNFELLKVLSKHLLLVVDNSDTNKMTLRNVGIVFSPTMNIPAGVFSLFIAEYNSIFKELEQDRPHTVQSNLSEDAPRRDRSSMTDGSMALPSIVLDAEQSYNLLQQDYADDLIESAAPTQDNGAKSALAPNDDLAARKRRNRHSAIVGTSTSSA